MYVRNGVILSFDFISLGTCGTDIFGSTLADVVLSVVIDTET